MIRFVLILLTLLGNPATAEVVSIRSGDHPTFTRLVVSIPVGRDWRLGRNGAGYEIDTGGVTDTFDLTAAFEKIQRDRVATLAPGGQPGRLRIDLACDCHAQAFLWQPDKVVIDIVDGPAPAESRYELALDPPTLATPEGPASVVIIPPPVVLPLTITGPGVADLSVVLPAPDAVSATVPTPPDSGSENARITATEQEIIESFARAASQGVLDVAMSSAQSDQQGSAAAHAESMDETTEVATPAHDIAAPSALAAFEITAFAASQPGITAQTSVDRGQPQSGTGADIAPDGGACLDDRLVDMEHWGDERAFASQIAEQISGLTSEFDAYPDGAVEALARTYLYFGFGREAMQALALDGVDSQQRRVMAAMAHLVDQEPDPDRLFAGQLGCANESALWTVLSRGTFDGTNESERIAAMAGFRALPPMLRGHLGAQLAQIFVDFGETDVAETILEAARGNATAARVETDLTAAEITLETDGADAAIAALSMVAEADTRLTPGGLVQLIDLTLAEGHQVAPDLISLANTMQYEHRGEPIAATLIEAQARAMIANDAFDAAFELLSGPVDPLGTEDVATLRISAVLALTDRASDPAFLNFAFDDLPLTDSPTAENAVAARLVALGFADRAANLLRSPATGADARDRRYLEAEIAVQLGDFAVVEGLLGGMSDPRAGEIRAQALAAQGDFAAASSAGQVLPGSQPDTSEAWRAGDWQSLEHADDPLLRAASDAVLADPAVLDPTAPLAASRALLDEATHTRDLASQLLERFAVDPAAVDPATD